MNSQARKPLMAPAKTQLKFHLTHLEHSLCKLCHSHMRQNVMLHQQERFVQCLMEHFRGYAKRFTPEKPPVMNTTKDAIPVSH